MISSARVQALSRTNSLTVTFCLDAAISSNRFSDWVARKFRRLVRRGLVVAIAIRTHIVHPLIAPVKGQSFLTQDEPEERGVSHAK
jgi:hypothetical protein